MSQKKRPTRRDFLKTAGAGAGAAFGVPFIITSSALGNSERPAASDRIVMGGIGIGNMGRGDQWGYLNRKDVQYVAMCDVREEVRTRSKATIDGHYRNQRLQDLQRFSRAARPARYRRGPHRHARSLARDHHDRGLPQRQRRLLPEARNAHAAGRAADDRRGPAVRPRRLRRQPARARRLSQVGRSGLGGRIRHDQVDQRQRRAASQALQPAARRDGGKDRLGHVARPGPLGPVQLEALQRQLLHQRRELAFVQRLFGRRHDRLGRPSLRRGDLHLRRPRAAARGSDLSRRQRGPLSSTTAIPTA